MPSNLQDESISTSYSSDSALEVASQLRLSEPTYAPCVPTTINAYASPKISRNQPAFPDLPSPTEHLSKNSRTTTAHISRRPPRLTLPDEDHSSSGQNSSTPESPLASPVTPPSPSSTASPGPIVFASPSSSSFSFRTPFPSQEPLPKIANTSRLPLPKDWQTPLFSNEHISANANTDLDAHRRPDHVSHAYSYSTVGSARDEPSYSIESALPITPASPKKFRRDFAKDNSRDASPSPLSGKDKRNTSDHQTISSGSRRVLSTIQATTPLSSNRSHTLSLSLTRPTHTRSTSSATPTKTPFRSNSFSSPHVIPHSSFPSHSASPSPARSSEPNSSKSHKRSGSHSNSISLLRSISDRSKARFSRSIHTGHVSIDAVDYAAEQCENAFVSHDRVVGETIENRAIDVVNEEIESGESMGDAQVKPGSDKNVHRRSMFGKVKKLRGRVRKLMRDMRASMPSAGIQRDDGVHVRVEMVNTQQGAAVGPSPFRSFSSDKTARRKRLPRFSLEQIHGPDWTQEAAHHRPWTHHLGEVNSNVPLPVLSPCRPLRWEEVSQATHS